MDDISKILKKTSYAVFPILSIAAILTANLFLSQDSALKTLQNSEKSFGGPILSNLGSAFALAAVSSPSNPKLLDSDNGNFREGSVLMNNSALLGPSQKISESRKSDSSYLIIPTTGWNWGQLHNYNAVDIADSCGTPIYAAADGMVSESVAKGWNNGYGQYISIEHPNGIETLYSHLSQNVAVAGKYVFQGDLIGYMGNTGNTHGPTGCHLHFEVYGAKNPLAK